MRTINLHCLTCGALLTDAGHYCPGPAAQQGLTALHARIQELLTHNTQLVEEKRALQAAGKRSAVRLTHMTCAFEAAMETLTYLTSRVAPYVRSPMPPVCPTCRLDHAHPDGRFCSNIAWHQHEEHPHA